MMAGNGGTAFTADEKILRLAKASAAARQTEAAINALRVGDYDIAITLAGAAEGMLPEPAEGQTLFAVLRDHPVGSAVSKKGWVAALNAERDWLKHENQWLGEEIEIGVRDAALMVMRAMSRQQDWTPLMHDFKDWALKTLFGSFYPPSNLDLP